ncbi:MAG: xylose isomerase, partial [Betaproteobacteria bacterium]
VAPGVPYNAAMARRPGLPGRAIQFPLLETALGVFHAEPWQAERLQPWKDAVRDLLQWMRSNPDAAPRQISCEFIPFADYGGGARYSIWDNNIACAKWLREEWDVHDAQARSRRPKA